MNKSHIRLLAPELCNQIAAGEVVERPASVVKELIENSLDAGAAQIDTRIDNGGQSLIRVQDDGAGIAAAELELAVTRHATSKITRAEDLDRILSYGFRGEALPSIASVSQFRIISAFPADGKQEGVAASLGVAYGKNLGIEQAALRKGTVVEARDLFANLPGRLKFLKQPASELKRAQAWLTRLALAKPEIGFSLSAGDRQIMRFAKGETLRQRLGHIWPADIIDELLPLNTTLHGINVSGYASPPHLHQPKADRVWFYVNGRAINDRRLLAAVREAYKGRQIGRDYPQLILFLDINPAEVDVNAHPAKTEVRFRNESAVFSAVLGSLGSAFAAKSFAPYQESGFWGEIDSDRIMPKRQPPIAAAPTAPDFPSRTAAPRPVDSQILQEAKAEYDIMPTLVNSARPGFAPAPPPAGGFPGLGQKTSQPAPANLSPACPSQTYLGQIANTYLVLSDEESLVLVDQHAAHERVLFHKFASGGMNGTGQKLIVPIELAMDSARMESLEAALPLLEQLGFHFQRHEGGSLLVDAICPLLSRTEARGFLTERLDGRIEGMEKVWTSMACHAAIKAGQKLGSDEALDLLREWRRTPDADFCPHGRPCALRWDEAALERLFKRR